MLRETLQSVRTLPLNARFVLAAAGVNQLGAVLEGFLLVYLVHVGFGTEVAAWAVGAFAVGTLVGAPVGASATTRLGPRRAMVVALCGTGLLVATIPAAAASGDPAAVLALAVAVGITTQAFRPPSSEALSVAAPGPTSVVAFSAFRVAMNAGALVAPLLAAAAIAADRWTLLFLLDAVTSLGAAALVARTSDSRAPGHESSPPSEQTGRRGLLTRRRAAYLVAMLTSGIVYAQTFSVVPLELAAAGHPAALYATILAVAAVTLVVLELPVTTATTHWPVPTAVFVGTLLFGGSFLLYGIAAQHAIAALVASALSIAGTTISAPRLWSFPSGAPPSVRPAFFAASQAAFGIGMGLGPVLGVRAWEAVGQSWWVGVAAIGAVSAVAGAAGTRQPARLCTMASDVAKAA